MWNRSSEVEWVRSPVLSIEGRRLCINEEDGASALAPGKRCPSTGPRPAPIRYTAGMSSESLIETGTPRYARVVLPIPVDQSFTYEIPGTLRGRVRVGQRVEVPFGKRRLNGVVVELAEIADVPRIRPLGELQETFAPPPTMPGLGGESPN